MRTTLSLSVPKTEARRGLSHRSPGFSTLSDYLRFLLSQDDRILISEADLVQRSKKRPRYTELINLCAQNRSPDFLK